jgi:hypothetical protein
MRESARGRERTCRCVSVHGQRDRGATSTLALGTEGLLGRRGTEGLLPHLHWGNLDT